MSEAATEKLKAARETSWKLDSLNGGSAPSDPPLTAPPAEVPTTTEVRRAVGLSLVSPHIPDSTRIVLTLYGLYTVMSGSLVGSASAWLAEFFLSTKDRFPPIKHIASFYRF